MRIKRLCICAVMLALGTVLSLIKIFHLPLGGSVTLLSMLPVCMIPISCGTKHSIIPCILYGCIQMFIDGVFGWGLTPSVLIGAIVFDYLLAYGSLFISGIWADKKNGIISGIALAMLMRFLCHFISGCIFFKSFELFNDPYIWSLAYNGSYMLPELIFTVLASYFIFKTDIKKYIGRYK